MIVAEYLNNGTLVKHYSDRGFEIEQVETGERYGEAVDLVPCRYTYIEVEKYEDSGEEISAEEALTIILGGEGV